MVEAESLARQASGTCALRLPETVGMPALPMQHFRLLGDS
jgi:hypothetical protein